MNSKTILIIIGIGCFLLIGGVLILIKTNRSLEVSKSFQKDEQSVQKSEPIKVERGIPEPTIKITPREED